MSKRILGLDLGSNSIGWALLKVTDAGKPIGFIDLGSRIFNKAVEDKTPTPKNQKRRNSRLARRVVQRRARRRQRMLNYLMSLNLLPASLKDHPKPERILNELGDPYSLRAKALDSPLDTHELGRIFLHLVQRRGFLSNRKTLLGQEMLDDPDVQAVLAELGEDTTGKDAEETTFKQNISQLRKTIEDSGCRTLGEYLASRDLHRSKRNRQRDGGHLRTDRQMYQEELNAIWKAQKKHHPALPDKVKEQIEQIIFYQRPLRLRADRVGKCSLEPRCTRARIARLEYQKFRYLQDINNLQFSDPYTKTWSALSDEGRATLATLFERTPTLTFARLCKALGLTRKTEFNLERAEVKKLKGNTTACAIREILPEWDAFSQDEQYALVEDLLTIQKKAVLKKRLLSHWKFDSATAVRLCVVEFEPGHGNVSTKAIRKLLPYLERGKILSESRAEAGYGYEQEDITAEDRLGPPPTIANPIVQKGLHELRRVVNAIIAEYGKPDAVHIEMARDLEMNTKRYAAFLKQQKANTKANDEAAQKYVEMRQKNSHLPLSEYPSRNDKLKYRLWKDQKEKCAYSGKPIILSELFGPAVEIDHILPYSQSLDDSYMNKVVCYTAENRDKHNRTPIDAFGDNEDKWNQITQAIGRWGKALKSKRERFYKREADLLERDFIGNQLTDTRYISREAGSYLRTLSVDVTFPKAAFTGWLRHQWDLNRLLGETDEKERTDHRHHAIDAAVIACIDPIFHQRLSNQAKKLERSHSELKLRDLHIPLPWSNFRLDMHEKLSSLIVSHVPQRKISGALHEETGVGFIEGNRVDGPGTVYRKALNTDFKVPWVDDIIDSVVRERVRAHLANHNTDPKQAFAYGKIVVHKNGTTPIKRARVRQSKVPDLDTLKKTKFGARDRQGKVFRWMAYGNTHHVEIIRHRKTGKYEGRFVTAMEAAHRAKGINGPKRPVIQTDHGEAYEFMVVLHINDLVSIKEDGKRELYRVQKFEQDGLELRLHTAATLKNNAEKLRKSVSTLMQDYALQKYLVNAIGKLRDDKTDHRHQ